MYKSPGNGKFWNMRAASYGGCRVIIDSYHSVFEAENCFVPEGMQERIDRYEISCSLITGFTNTCALVIRDYPDGTDIIGE